MSKQIYLDYNASTPLAAEVIDAMTPYLYEGYGNPSASHWAGNMARQAISQARKQLAALLNSKPEEVVFTSGGTESNNHAIKGVYEEKLPSVGNPHVITSQIEHPAVLEPCCYLERNGAEITRLSVDQYGQVDPEDVRSAIRANTVLISIMHANNEVGTIQPIRQIGQIAREHGVLFHTDAAQSVGKIPTDVQDTNVDLLSVAGHKFYAPKGVGALYIRSGTGVVPLLHGAPP